MHEFFLSAGFMPHGHCYLCFEQFASAVQQLGFHWLLLNHRPAPES